MSIIQKLSEDQMKSETGTDFSEENKENPVTNAAHPENSNLISKDIESSILEKLSKFEKSEKFIKKDITLASLSSQLDTNTNYLSQVINNNKNKNFSTYINELRVQYIIRKIHTNPDYHNYKISYLAEECGMPYSTFMPFFKKFTGMTPSDFIKQAVISKKKTDAN